MIAERFSTFLILSKSKKGTKHLIQKEARRASRLWLGRGVNGSLFSSGKSKWYRNLESLLTEDLFHSGSEEISQDLKTLPGIVLSLSHFCSGLRKEKKQNQSREEHDSRKWKILFSLGRAQKKGRSDHFSNLLTRAHPFGWDVLKIPRRKALSSKDGNNNPPFTDEPFQRKRARFGFHPSSQLSTPYGEGSSVRIPSSMKERNRPPRIQSLTNSRFHPFFLQSYPYFSAMKPIRLTTLSFVLLYHECPLSAVLHESKVLRKKQVLLHSIFLPRLTSKSCSTFDNFKACLLRWLHVTRFNPREST